MACVSGVSGRMYSCECYQIGAGFIEVDPDCPAHGVNPVRGIERPNDMTLDDAPAEMSNENAWAYVSGYNAAIERIFGEDWR